MGTPDDPLTLAHWRRTVAEMYAPVRRVPEADRAAALHTFRDARDRLFKFHPQSPLEPDQRLAFSRLPYYSYDPGWRVVGTIDTRVPHEPAPVQLLAEGELRSTRVAQIRFEIAGTEARLNLYWIEGYGGGLFLPFRDATSGNETYGGGRYLYDTIKGADPSTCEDKDRIVLDFNYAYNPSCAYSLRWVCPLAPAENWLPFPVEAGEMEFRQLRE